MDTVSFFTQPNGSHIKAVCRFNDFPTHLAWSSQLTSRCFRGVGTYPQSHRRSSWRDTFWSPKRRTWEPVGPRSELDCLKIRWTKMIVFGFWRALPLNCKTQALVKAGDSCLGGEIRSGLKSPTMLGTQPTNSRILPRKTWNIDKKKWVIWDQKVGTCPEQWHVIARSGIKR